MKKVASESYRVLKKDKLPSMSDEEAASLLSSNGMLIKRPLVLDNGEATFGFKEEVYEEKWKR